MLLDQESQLEFDSCVFNFRVIQFAILILFSAQKNLRGCPTEMIPGKSLAIKFRSFLSTLINFFCKIVKQSTDGLIKRFQYNVGNSALRTAVKLFLSCVEAVLLTRVKLGHFGLKHGMFVHSGQKLDINFFCDCYNSSLDNL